MKKDSDSKKLSDIISTSRSILKILYIFIIVLGVYAVIILFKELNIFPVLLKIIGIIAPLFIGLIIAWLFNPAVTFMEKKGIKRIWGSALCYVVFIGIMVIIVSALIPVLSEQINDFVGNTIPNLVDKTEVFIDDVADKFTSVKNFDAESLKVDLMTKLEKWGTDLSSSLPTIAVNVIKGLFSGLGTFLIGLIIGFYLLVSFDKSGDTIYEILPKKIGKSIKDLLNVINVPLRKFVQGALIDCSLIFVICLIGFMLIGLKAPLLFALFCAITNIIPFAGPYIGGAPAVLVGFSQSTTIGIVILIFIVIIQTLEGNLFQPFIMSKTTKLNPVTIILGLLVFGYFFGIWGMILSTPIIGAIKAIIVYYDDKYDILNFN